MLATQTWTDNSHLLNDPNIDSIFLILDVQANLL